MHTIAYFRMIKEKIKMITKVLGYLRENKTKQKIDLVKKNNPGVHRRYLKLSS